MSHNWLFMISTAFFLLLIARSMFSPPSVIMKCHGLALSSSSIQHLYFWMTSYSSVVCCKYCSTFVRSVRVSLIRCLLLLLLVSMMFSSWVKSTSIGSPYKWVSTLGLPDELRCVTPISTPWSPLACATTYVCTILVSWEFSPEDLPWKIIISDK